MDAAAIDAIRVNFSPQMLMIINIAIGIMMLGVALDLRMDDFRLPETAPG